jgi:hypothetical protein
LADSSRCNISETCSKFPPLQAPRFCSLQLVMEEIKAQKRGIANKGNPRD